MRTTSPLASALALVLLALGASPVVSASSAPALTCRDAKAKAAGKKASALLKAFARNVRKSDAFKLSSDISKVQSRFTRSFTRAEAPGGCQTMGDAGAVEAIVDALVASLLDDIVAPTLPPVCGDGILEVEEECDASAPRGEAACPKSGQCLPPVQIAGDVECICAFDPTPVMTGGAHRGVARPVTGGNSVFNSTGASCLDAAGFIVTGTLGAIVFPATNPTVPHLLSNDHVLGRQSDHDSATTDDLTRCAGTAEASAGDPVMQPGTLDGGTIGADDVGVLPPFVLAGTAPSLDPYEPICFPGGFCPGATGFPRPLCNGGACVDGPAENCIDAAIAEVTVLGAMPTASTAAILDIGPNLAFGAPIGPPTCKDADVDWSLIGRIVKKSGRTTGLTYGRITGITDVLVTYGAGICSIASGNNGEDCLVDADCPVSTTGACVLVDTGYAVPLGGAALFVNQLLITPVAGAADFSRGGDSGSLILTGADEPVGLLFAGGDGSTIANPVKPVLTRFGVQF